jgi:uncharacterized membrane protein YeaQ/YmgE (transglycosylase-associated protein family)
LCSAAKLRESTLPAVAFFDRLAPMRRRSLAIAHDGFCMGRAIMDIGGLIILLIVGAIAGWLAGLIVKGYGFGLIGNIVVGIIGAVIAGFLLPYLHINIGGGFIAAIINALIGAVILLVIIGLVRR